MSISSSERRQIENEMIFRRANEKNGNDLTKLDAMHRKHHNADLIRDEDLLLHFMCECSDEDCKLRIPMKLSLYEKIHTSRDVFIALPGHQADRIETVTKQTSTYIILKKNNTAADPAGGLNKTSVNNV